MGGDRLATHELLSKSPTISPFFITRDNSLFFYKLYEQTKVSKSITTDFNFYIPFISFFLQIEKHFD